jgi:hypothetical protein
MSRLGTNIGKALKHRVAFLQGATTTLTLWAGVMGGTLNVNASIDGKVRKETGLFLRHLYIKVIILPRQARDKHRESTQKRDFFSQVRKRSF